MERKFVTQTELDEQRKQRQAEWDKVRKPDDPEEAPEEEYDPRSLFERLRAEKIKKQEEYEESHRLKNLIYVLDEDESSFLEKINQNKMDEEARKSKEEKEAIEELRKAIGGLTRDEQAKKLQEFKISFSLKGIAKKSKKTLKKPLSNLIRIKTSDDSENKSTLSSDPHLDDSDQKDEKVDVVECDKDTDSISQKRPLNVIKTSLVAYGSDSEDSEKDDETTDQHNKKLKTTL